MKKRGQFQLSYGFIFSVILIAIFVFAAIYVIYIFLNIGDKVETSMLINKLQNDVNRIYNSRGGEDRVFSYELKRGEGVTHICFYNSGIDPTDSGNEMYLDIRRSMNLKNNIYFYPRKYAKTSAGEIKHIDISSLETNPFCIGKEGNEFKIRLSKMSDEVFVGVS